MKKLISVLLAVLTVLFCFTACGGHASVQGNTLRFTNRVKDMQKLEGQEVELTGYMSTLMPDKDYFFYLSSTPYNDEPFSGDHSSELADTIAVYAKPEEGFTYTDELITVTGILVFEDITDSVGYSYSYRIKNASVAAASEENLSKDAKKWQQLTQAGVVAELDKMFAYLEFVCKWPTLTMTVDGESRYLSGSVARYNVGGESSSFGYGAEEGYFDSIIQSIKNLDEKAFSELVEIVETAQSLSDKALTALRNGEYSSVAEYSGIFSDGRQQYALNDESIKAEFDALEEDYEAWLQEQKL